MTTPTLRERMARLETLVEGLIEHNKVRDRWTLRIIGGLVIGVVLMGLPGCVRLLAGVSS
ncbi:hypothetical protein LCGC14_2716060 [marine sediment metagenome]|uniref:Uncharacterized protein n=1 Tax=marine sediment metagenome TaxID=412755 RepID=A0A0F8ZZ45_9ZZZZ